MATIINRSHKHNGATSAGRRAKFMRRVKEAIKGTIDKTIKDSDIVDVFKKDKKIKLKKDLKEPWIHYRSKSGQKDYVITDNDQYFKGQSIPKPSNGGDGKPQAGNSGEGEDEFTFTLTKEELVDLFFENLELPDFMKKSLKGSDTLVLQRAGYVPEGTPSRLDLRKTFENSLARRIAFKNSKKKVPFFDDIDLRFRNFVKKPKPITKAVMFCIMDVSASMDESRKFLAKKFFLLLYLFLHKAYKNVEIVFIRHTTVAAEVNENEFFHDTRSGGTYLSSGTNLAKKIIEERYPLDEWNIYVSHASDGENFPEDLTPYHNSLDSIIPLTQYFCFISVGQEIEHYLMPTLTAMYEKYIHKFDVGVILEEDEVYEALVKLFIRGKSHE